MKTATRADPILLLTRCAEAAGAAVLDAGNPRWSSILTNRVLIQMLRQGHRIACMPLPVNATSTAANGRMMTVGRAIHLLSTDEWSGVSRGGH